MAFDDLPEADKHKQRDFDDINNELAGRETGRMARFFNKIGGSENETARRRQRADTLDLLSKLDQWLQDPEYAALYNGVLDLIARAEAVTETAIAMAKTDLAEMEANAGRLLDGTAVFMDQNGDVFTADGQTVDPDIAAGVQWPDGAPSYEDYLRRRTDLEELLRYQTDTLGGTRDRLNDPENPPTPDELRDWERRIESEAPDAIKTKIEESEVIPGKSEMTSAIVAKPF